jgi:arylsulfatase
MCCRAESNAADTTNIIFIMGDDIGWFNIGAYNQGIMAGRTPHLDKLAAEGMRFTDYYAEASCTAGRANFITGQLPIRTGLTTVGQAGATVGMPGQAPTIATALKSMGYATGQFGKNHLGDRNEYLPTVLDSTSSSICITWTRWKTRAIATTRLPSKIRWVPAI